MGAFKINEIKKAKIFKIMLEEGYTCMINFYILNDEGRTEFIQGFGGKKFHTYQDYETWKIGIENIINRRFEDSIGAMIKVIVTDNDDILGIGNLNENYWITKEMNERETEFNFKTTQEKIEDFLSKTI